MADHANIAIWYGLHLDEKWARRRIARLRWEMLRLYGELQSRGLYFIPRPFPRGYRNTSRGVIENITDCSPGRAQGGSVDEQHAWWIQNLAMAGNVVLDIHENTIDSDFVYVNKLALESELAMGLASLVGRDHPVTIITEPGHPATHLDIPYVAWDLSRKTTVFEFMETWLVEISFYGWVPPTRDMPLLEGEGTITLEQAKSLGLADLELPPFTRLPERMDNALWKMGFTTPLYTLGGNGPRFADIGLWGEVGTPVACSVSGT